MKVWRSRSTVRLGSRTRTAASCVAAAILLTTTTAAGGAPLREAADQGAATRAGDTRPRTIITTDPELDDLNSMLHMLLYSNEMRIDGLIYASGQYHWAGDGRGTTFFKEDREYDTPQTSWRWKPGQSHIEDAIDAYAKVYGNLRTHARGYPSPRTLRSKYRVGNIEFEGDISKESPGSRLIEEALLDRERGPVYLQAWGGPSTIARALKSIEEKYRGTRGWKRIYAKVSAKAVITKFGSQDSTYADYIAPNWPDIEMRDLATTTWGYGAPRAVLPQDQYYLQPAWMKKNVSDVGPMGAAYRVWGDGKFMSPGDKTDFFGFDSSTTTVEQLRAEGYNVWLGRLYPKGSWISEGDSSNWAILVANGLRSFEDANYGGWGGRAQQNPADPSEHLGSLATDTDPAGQQPTDYKTARWFPAIMNDFAARLQWTVRPRYRQANHEPEALISTTQRTMAARPGQRVRLLSRTSDPDGDATASRWTHYREAGTYPGRADVSEIYHRSGRGWSYATATVPADAKPGQRLHFILQVTDDGRPALTSYQRVVLTVR